MKIRSLVLGSLAVAGLATGAHAADLGVMTSLDVCDSFGLSGLTISSDGNCLQITGGISYEFNWGDYRFAEDYFGPGTDGNLYDDSDLVIGFTPFSNFDGRTIGIITDSDAYPGQDDDELTDYESKVEAWLKFVGTSDTDFGPAKAVLKIKSISQSRYWNENVGPGGSYSDVDSQDFEIDEGYVSVGDSTVIMAGKKGSIANFGDSQPFNYLTTFGYSEVDTGILFQNDEDEAFLGGHVIQVTTDLGNGISASAGLENLSGDEDTDGLGDGSAGTAVGVLAYKGDTITAHVTGFAAGILDGDVDFYGVHAGATGTFDVFKIRGTVGYLSDEDTDDSLLHALLSGEATFDMFTVALSGEYIRSEEGGVESDGFGVGGSIGAGISDGVKINLGGRYFSDDDSDTETGQLAAQVVASVTETITVTGEVGAYFSDVYEDDAIGYGAIELGWKPGTGFSTSVKGEANSAGAYKATFKAAKTFE